MSNHAGLPDIMYPTYVYIMQHIYGFIDYDYFLIIVNEFINVHCVCNLTMPILYRHI